jgi:hypothetical protein
VRLLPEVFIFPLSRKKSGRRPFPLFCLAPHGVSPATTLTRWSGGLLPRLFNLALHPRGAGRYVFCDTFRRPKLSPRTPPLSRGMLPFGVRTFLWHIKLRQRPPVTAALIPQKGIEFHQHGFSNATDPNCASFLVSFSRGSRFA